VKGLFKLPVLVSLTVLLGAACVAQGPLVSKATPKVTPTSSSQSPSPLAVPSQSPSQSLPQPPSASPSPSQQASPASAYAGPGSWISRGEMSTPRADFAAVAFSSGEVLLIGGETSSTTDTATVDLFQPPSDTFNPNPPPPMKTPRNGLSATLLPNGKVLVAGGSSTPNGPALASAELYDPTTNTWSDAAPMAEARAHHVAVLMNNGRVFVAGGDGGGGVDPQTNEIYDPVTNTWTGAQTFFGYRPSGPALAVLSDGRVMIFGGVSLVQPGNNLEIYDPGPVRTTQPGAR